jgi:hypothetical protein
MRGFNGCGGLIVGPTCTLNLCALSPPFQFSFTLISHKILKSATAYAKEVARARHSFKLLIWYVLLKYVVSAYSVALRSLQDLSDTIKGSLVDSVEFSYQFV